MKKYYPSFLLSFTIAFSFAQYPVTPFNPAQEPYYHFGCSVDVFNSNIIVAEDSGNIVVSPENNKAYLFTNQNGTIQQQAVFSPADLSSGDNFGKSVSVSDDYAAITAPSQGGSGIGDGAVYIYHHINNDWELSQKLTHPDGLSNTRFGQSVKIYGNFLFIGAPNELTDVPPVNYGVVCVYRLIGGVWQLSERLNNSDWTLSFGSKIECADNMLIVSGSTATGQTGFYPYYLNNTTWLPQTTGLAAGDLESNILDWSYAENHIYLLVENLDAADTIEELVYDGSTSWGWDHLVLRTCTYNDQIFNTIKVLGDKMFVGSNDYSYDALRKFPLQYFKKTAGNWIAQSPIYGTAPENTDDYFGSSLAGYGNTLIIGSPREGNSQALGKVYSLNISLGIADLQQNALNIYPNPVVDIAHISENALPIEQLDLYSITGTKLFSTSVKDRQFSMQQFAAGVYFAKLKMVNGAFQTIKIVKN